MRRHHVLFFAAIAFSAGFQFRSNLGDAFLKDCGTTPAGTGSSVQRIASNDMEEVLRKKIRTLALEMAASTPEVSSQHALAPASKRSLLTVIVEHPKGGLTDVFFNLILPHWMQWRFMILRDPVGPALDRVNTDVLVVSRSQHIRKWAKWAAKYRARFSVGLLHRADERNAAGDKDSGGAEHYGKFDYVLRNYYFPTLLNASEHMVVRALGNLTCGTGPPLPASAPEESQMQHQGDDSLPALGVHYVPLFAWRDNVMHGRPSGAELSVWPASRRETACSFTGSMRGDRREMVAAMEARAELQCDIRVAAKFGGEQGALEFLYEQGEAAVFALCPHGNSAETHRAWELLEHGSIPVMMEAPYHAVPFQPWPGLIGRNWTDLAGTMLRLLDDNVALDAMQAAAVAWQVKYKSCMRGDMHQILSRAFARHGRTK